MPQPVKRFGPYTRFGINFHLGNSADVLPALLESIREPAVVYLDGHLCKTNTEYTAAAEFPLWAKLTALSKRPYREIVIVDALGRERVIDHYIHRDHFVVFLSEAASAS